MCKSYNELKELLNSIELNKFYLNNFSSRDYVIDYGQKKGVKKFSSVKEAAVQFDYEIDDRYIINIDKQLNILNGNCKETNIEILLACIEIFDWGGVQKFNTIEALYRYRNGILVPYLQSCKQWFEDDTTLIVNVENAIWSSGWTKVYSFMFDYTCIYDSRVSAFINHILVSLYHSSVVDEKGKKQIKHLCSKLISFSGNALRKRSVGKVDRQLLSITGKSTKVKRNLVANKVCSWVVRYIAEIEYEGKLTQENFRNIDKAAFMLGFDIEQIDHETTFT